MLRAIISLNGHEREIVCNQNRLTELQHEGYVLERVIERVPVNAINNVRERPTTGGAG